MPSGGGIGFMCVRHFCSDPNAFPVQRTYNRRDLTHAAHPESAAAMAMKMPAAGRDRVCSQSGPTASVMSQATKNVQPAAMQNSAALSRRQLRSCRGEGLAAT